MGATTFTTNVIPLTDPRAAFAKACEDARYSSGNEGYTGTVAEKDGYVICSDKVLSEHSAVLLADQLINDDDPRVTDKWGPAGAIPIACATRTETVVIPVTNAALRAKLRGTLSREFLVELAKSHLKIKKGETIESAQLTSSNLASVQSEAHLSVTVRKAEAGTLTKRTVTVTVPLGAMAPGYNDAVKQAIITKLKLKSDAVLGSYRHTAATRKTKPTTKRGTSRETRYVVIGDREHQSFENGYATLALANARLRQLGASPVAQDQYEVQGVIRAKDGSALTTTTVTTVSTTLTIEVEVTTGERLTTRDGWLFFGWASC
jgi:hypothetical protein